ncbi:hypothetical protein M404DRAFT_993061 [Pisolithus tinctorius Marx 270]|uniref:Uncharacterized protein n=1 Tax=Pisolithus tinctorius Marx 270 TaxID=870435 RepID=A0A0C3PX38_PISTI|nr:hypothetical protein M404DRAFT_993061 [Pisolithus tinctorius Marx 270]
MAWSEPSTSPVFSYCVDTSTPIITSKQAEPDPKIPSILSIRVNTENWVRSSSQISQKPGQTVR